MTGKKHLRHSMSKTRDQIIDSVLSIETLANVLTDVTKDAGYDIVKINEEEYGILLNCLKMLEANLELFRRTAKKIRGGAGTK